MMDKMTLFSQALSTLGDREYVRDSPTGNACDLWFPDVMHEALLFGAWSFATRRETLQPLRPGVYRMPSDSLRLLSVDALRYELVGDEIHVESSWGRVGEDGLDVKYISNRLAKTEELPENQPLFCRGVMLLLAARVSPKVTTKMDIAMALEAQAKDVLSEALYRDAQMRDSNDQHPLADILNSSII